MAITELMMRGLVTTVLSSATTAPTTGSTFAMPNERANKLSYVCTTSNVTSLNLVHEVSMDGTNFKAVATDSSSTGTIGSFETTYPFYRSRIVAGTGTIVSVQVVLGAL